MEGKTSKEEERWGERERRIQKLRESYLEEPTHNSLKEQKAAECCICLGKKCDSILPCMHAFHKKCITEWFDRHGSCPICRKEVRLAEVQAI